MAVGHLGATLTGMGLVLAATCVTVNYIYFHYMEINGKEIRQFKYFGLVRSTIQISDLTSIDTRPMDTSFGIMKPSPSVRFNSPQRVIELGQTYPTRKVKEALSFLNEKSVPIDKKLLSEFHVERDPGELPL